MQDFFRIACPFSIIFPVIMGILRFNLIQSRFKPFVYLLLIGFISEILWFIFYLKKYIEPQYARSNIYILIEFIFYLWFFKNVLKSVKVIWLKPIVVLGLVVWVYENFYLNKLQNAYDYYFQIGYSLVLALLAIECINEVLIKERGSLLKSGLFLISSGMVIYFTFEIFVEIEMNFAGVEHKAFFNAIFAIEQWINCFVNLVFALAVLWIPTKVNFTKPFL